VVVGQVPANGVGAGVQAGRGQLLAELDDQVGYFGRDRGRGGLGPSGPWLEDSVPLGAVALQELVEPGLGDAVLEGDFTDRTFLDHHGGDQQSVESHARTLTATLDSVRDDSRHQSAMS
jgi:hypothetical protein